MPWKNKKARRKYQREQRNRVRNDWLRQYGFRCVDCGAAERSYDKVIHRHVKLEADHEDPSTKATHRPQYDTRPYNGNGQRHTSADIFSRSKAFREAELAKCRPRCQRCHNRRTIAQRWKDDPEEVPF